MPVAPSVCAVSSFVCVCVCVELGIHVVEGDGRFRFGTQGFLLCLAGTSRTGEGGGLRG